MPLPHILVHVYVCNNFIVHVHVGLNDHSYNVEKPPRHTAKPWRPAYDPPKEWMLVYNVGMVLQDWSIQFLECCYNILMKVVRVNIHVHVHICTIQEYVLYGL